MAEITKLNSKEEPDELESALAVLREIAGNEAAAARIVDRILNDLVKPHHRSLSWGDRLLTLDKSAGFANDRRFKSLLRQIDPSKGHNQYASPDRLSWRLHTMIWAAAHALKVPGDFIECGTAYGDMPWAITEALEFARAGKKFYAYDTFEGFDPRYSSELDFPEAPQFFRTLQDEARVDPLRYETVVKRFAAKPYVTIVRGVVPDILRETAPERVAFLHLDMNSPGAQLGALDFLFGRLSHGAIVIFDDYGWILYRREKEVADEFLAARGHRVLELPTGQGLVIIR